MPIAYITNIACIKVCSMSQVQVKHYDLKELSQDLYKKIINNFLNTICLNTILEFYFL